MHTRYTGRSLGRELVLIAVAAAFCLPFYLLVAIALEPTAQTYTKPLSFPRPPRWGNFSQAWGAGGQSGLAHPLLSSLIITVSSVALLIVLGSLCAYVVARHRGRLSDALYVGFVIGIVLPFQLSIIPLVVAMHHLGLVGNYAGMIVLNVGLLIPLTVFLYTGFIRALPRDYEEAALVDGAGILPMFFRVVFPLLLPVTATVALLLGVVVWNEFFTALIILAGSKIETVPVALYSYASAYVARWNLIFAGVTLALAPVLVFYVFAQRHLIHGFTGGVKG